MAAAVMGVEWEDALDLRKCAEKKRVYAAGTGKSNKLSVRARQPRCRTATSTFYAMMDKLMEMLLLLLLLLLVLKSCAGTRDGLGL